MLTLSNYQHLPYDLDDLYPYVQRYDIPLEEQNILSKLGFVIRQYLYNTIEFKLNCRIGMDDRLMSCYVSLLPQNTPSPASLRNKKRKSLDTDFYVAFNVRRAQSWDEPNSVLFKYPKYSKSTTSASFHTSKGIQLDFLAKNQLKCMVMASSIKAKTSIKKRRSSAQSLLQSKTCTDKDRAPPMTPLPKAKSNGNTNVLTAIASNTAIIYPQDNILWSYFKNKAKVLDQNAWLPIVSLWRQNDAHIVYMLRGSNKKALLTNTTHSHRRKRASSLKNDHIRTFTQSAPIPALSSTERPRMHSLSKISKQCRKRKKKHRKSHHEQLKTIKDCKQERVKKKKDTFEIRARGFSIKTDKHGGYKEENKEKNPCKLYEIIVTQNEVICKNIFNFPHLNIQHELTWFDVETRSLLLIINKAKGVELHIIKHTVYPHHAHRIRKRATSIPQSTTSVCKERTRTRCRSAKTPTKRKMSASELFHMKLDNESLKIRLKPRYGYENILHDCHCLKLFHHKDTNTYILLLQKQKKQSVSKVLLKLRINFLTTEIEAMAYGIVDEAQNERWIGEQYDIVGYDYNRSLLIIDTLYEPLSPLHCNVSSVNKKIVTPPPSNIYKQYNKWFSFASKKFVKTKSKVITKKFVAIALSDFVCDWKTIYDCTKSNHKSIIISK